MAITLYVEKSGDLILVESPSSRAWYTIWDGDKGAGAADLWSLKGCPEGWGWRISEKLLSKLIFVAGDHLLFWE